MQTSCDKALLCTHEPELLPEGILVCGRRYDSAHTRIAVVGEGKSVHRAVLDMLPLLMPGRDDAQYERMAKLCRVRLDDEELARPLWKETYLRAGSRMEMLYAPGKGGGGKNPIATVLSLVVAVAAFAIGQAYLAPYIMSTAWGVGATAGTMSFLGSMAFGASMGALMMGGTLLVNALFPVSAALPNAQAQSSLESSPTYSLSGGQNSANPNGYVPLVLGTYRVTPPLGAKSWTMYQGDDQYLNMLVIWGHADMVVEDFRIGETPLSKFEGVSHLFHGSSYGNDLRYFSKSYNEQSIGATLNYNEPVTRSIGECDSISVDISFSALAELSTGSARGRSVTFRIEYAHEGQNDWKALGSSYRFFAPAQYCDTYTGASEADAWCTPDGTWSSWVNGNYGDIPAGGIRVTDSHWSVYPCTRYKDKHKHHEWWFQDAWYDSGYTYTVTISAAQTTPLSRSYEWAVPRGEYQVRITRLTEDTSEASVQDTAVWSVARAIVNRAAFSTPVPVACSELRIKASEELSGYVSDFNALCTSFVPDWNGTEWDTDETNNPASLLRYVLTSRHGSYNPFSEAKLDEQSFRDFHAFCKKEGFTFNFVCDAEAVTWKRIIQIAAAGRGTVTFDNDGLISVVIDRAGKTPVQMFTPRNSWGFSLERNYQKYPHALRAKFRNASDDYNEANNYVYADGYNASNSTNIVEWEAEGKTNWNEVWRFGRYYLASMRLRPETVTLSTDWEWRMCRRGDLVLVQHDVLTNTFGYARVQRLIYSVNGQSVYAGNESEIPQDDSGNALLPVGVQLDDTILFSEPSPARYGIAIRMNTGRVNTYEIVPQYGKESADVMFLYSITAAQVPPFGALVSCALMQESGMEVGEYLVSGITPGENMSADLTLIPYAPQIMDADTGAIPAWSAPVRIPGVPKTNNLPTPKVTEVRTDESVLIRSGSSLISCIAAWYSLPSSPDASLGDITVQMQCEDEFGNTLTANAPISQKYVQAQGAEDGRKYVIRLRLVSSKGNTSPWSTPYTAVVIGKTSRPPKVTNLSAVPDDPQGVKLTWDASTVLDFDHYEVTGAAQAKTIDNAITLPVYGRTGDLSFAVAAVDVIGLGSDKAGASCTVLAPGAPAPSYDVLPTSGATVQWANPKTTWSISHYVVEDLYAGETFTVKDERFSISPRIVGRTYSFHLYAEDIFGNRSSVADYAVTINPMGEVSPSCAIDGVNMVVYWKQVLSPFAIDHYEVQTVDGSSLGSVKGTEMRFLAPAEGVHGYRVRAVDIAGNASSWGECSFTITPPKAPEVYAAVEGDHINLSWSMPASCLPVVAFDVVRQWDEKREDGIIETHEEDYGRMDALALSVPAVTAGAHTFMVRAVDNAGNLSGWGYVDFAAMAPGAVTPYDCRAVYNNVMLYFTAPNRTMFPIREYIVEEVQGEYSAVIGTVDALFFAEVRSSAGVYTYGITPVDIAGNRGERATVDIKVSSPPDLVLLHEWESLFNGEKRHMLLNGNGAMVGPVPENETWQENILRVSEALGDEEGSITWQSKIAGDMPTFLSPADGQGTYVEMQDIGEVLSAPTIEITVTQKTLEGSPSMTCRIEVSSDNEEWRVAAENATNVSAENVRYVRFTFSWTGGMVLVSGIYISFSVRSVEDSGTVMCHAADCLDENGDFLPDEEFGTRVDFAMEFIDVENISVTPTGSETGLHPLVVFPEGAHSYPTGFNAALLDVTGMPVDGEVFWYAKGR